MIVLAFVILFLFVILSAFSRATGSGSAKN